MTFIFSYVYTKQWARIPYKQTDKKKTPFPICLATTQLRLRRATINSPNLGCLAVLAAADLPVHDLYKPVPNIGYGSFFTASPSRFHHQRPTWVIPDRIPWIWVEIAGVAISGGASFFSSWLFLSLSLLFLFYNGACSSTGVG